MHPGANHEHVSKLGIWVLRRIHLWVKAKRVVSSGPLAITDLLFLDQTKDKEGRGSVV